MKLILNYKDGTQSILPVKQIKLTKILLFILLASLLNIGCSSSADDVKLASGKEIINYASKLYGEAEFVRTKEYEEGRYVADNGFERYRPRSIEYTLKDKQYGFEYTVTSQVDSFGMDGSIFSYNETRISNFDDIYAEYIMSELHDWIAIESSYINVYIESIRHPEIIFTEIHVSSDTDIDKAIEFITLFGEKIREIDDRKWFSSPIYLMNPSNERIGSFELADGCYKSNDELYVDFYMERASALLQVNKNKLIYSHFEETPLTELKGLEDSRYEMYSSIGIEKEPCYYFEYNNKEYFVVAFQENNWYYQYVYNVTDDIIENIWKP